MARALFACLRLLLPALFALLAGLGPRPALALGQGPGPAQDQSQAGADVVVPNARSPVLELWPAVTMLSDPSGTMTLEQALARRADFARPDGPAANLGPRTDAVWLRVPLQPAADAPTHWVLTAEYASLDRLDLYLLQDGRPMRHVRLGRLLTNDERPWPSAWPAAAIALQPGQPQEVLLRVQTQSTMVLPLHLYRADAFHAREARMQAVQGLLVGIIVCLLLYSLTQWIGLRDPVYLGYALTLFGTAGLFLSLSGLGSQHLWGESTWWTVHAAPLAGFVTVIGGSLFIERTLEIGKSQPRTARMIQGVALGSLLLAVAFALNLMPYPIAQRLSSLLAPLPMLLGASIAWQRARAGDPIARYTLFGWGVYGVSVIALTALLRGWAPANDWTQHAFQLGAVFEMVMWMRVLSLRADQIRMAAQHLALERDAMRSLANTDALTGLPNRRGLMAAVEPSLLQSTPDRMIAVFLIDLDGFKQVNDVHGHETGDALLVEVARRLQGVMRASDIVARLGGDEFVVVAGHLGQASQARMIGRKMLQAFDAPVDIDGKVCRVGLTVGYALAPLDGRDAAELLRQADIAMYLGKQAGRHCLRRVGEELIPAGA